MPKRIHQKNMMKQRKLFLYHWLIITKLGIGIEADAAGIVIQPSSISVCYRTGYPYSCNGKSGIPAFEKISPRFCR
jgi:hypothetical protein